MLGNDYWYNESIKKVIALFGNIFNDLYIAKWNAEDKIKDIQRVPLAYAPRERYLARILEDENDTTIAIKLPRMAFEITSIDFDAESKLNRLNRTIQCDPATGERQKVWQSAPYTIGIQLSIMSRGHDEALQIVEQILPFFNPNYTVTVKGMEGPCSKTDIPITLGGVSFEDSYEGDFEGSRRLIIYTLEFKMPVRFVIPITSGTGIIKSFDVNNLDFRTGAFLSRVNVRTRYADDTADDFETVVNMCLDEPYEPGDQIWDSPPSNP